MNGEFLPGRQRLAAEPTGFVLWLRCGFDVTFFDLLPRGIQRTSSLDGGFRLYFGLGKLVFADKMLEEVVSAVAGVLAVLNVTSPPFQVL